LAKLRYENQATIGEDSISELGNFFGLSKNDFEKCLSSARHQEKVRHDIKQADALKIQGTPTVFINNRLYEGGFSEARVRFEIERLLRTM
jgi:protein-disulfide isomerase